MHEAPSSLYVRVMCIACFAIWVAFIMAARVSPLLPTHYDCTSGEILWTVFSHLSRHDKLRTICWILSCTSFFAGSAGNVYRMHFLLDHFQRVQQLSLMADWSAFWYLQFRPRAASVLPELYISDLHCAAPLLLLPNAGIQLRRENIVLSSHGPDPLLQRSDNAWLKDKSVTVSISYHVEVEFDFWIYIIYSFMF